MSNKTRQKVKKLKIRQRVGKYRIEKRLGDGAFASVYQAYDTIEGIRVALKVPHPDYVNDEVLKDFRSELKSSSRLDHENILPVKDASIIQERLVIAMPLGKESLADRLQRRLSTKRSIDFIEQLLDAVAHAHEHKIIHCDIKPENVILFPDGDLRLTDFGVAKVSHNTIGNTIRGTIGHMAPEQAMGKPSYRSDVFAVGLICYRMLSGSWPEWPFEWPLEGAAKLRGKVHPKLILWLKRSLEPSASRRFKDVGHMRNAYIDIRPTVRRHIERRKR